MAEAWQSDPVYLARQRALALLGANEESTTRSRQDRLRRQLSDALPEIARSGVLQRLAIGTGFEGRGMARSSVRQDTDQRSRYDEALRRTNLEKNTADQIADYENELAAARANRLAQGADAEGEARYRQYQLDAQNQFYADQLAALRAGQSQPAGNPVSAPPVPGDPYNSAGLGAHEGPSLGLGMPKPSGTPGVTDSYRDRHGPLSDPSNPPPRVVPDPWNSQMNPAPPKQKPKKSSGPFSSLTNIRWW